MFRFSIEENCQETYKYLTKLIFSHFEKSEYEVSSAHYKALSGILQISSIYLSLNFLTGRFPGDSVSTCTIS